MLDLIASCLVIGLSIVLYLTPIRLNLWMGRRIGILVYFLSGKRKHITYANLKAAFCGERTPGEIKRIAKEAYRNMAETFVEILSFRKINRGYLDKFVSVANPEYLREGKNNKHGIIFLSAHFGNWELSTAKSVTQDCPLHLLARDQKMKRLNELLNVMRESSGNIVIRKGADVKNIFRVLHQGKGVGILGDQNAGANGVLIDFFNRPASTAVGPFKFAEKSGALILPAFIHRENGPYHKIVLEKPMRIAKKEDVTPYMRQYNRLLEANIRENPDQWLWMHKRWKATPLKKVLILNDGKKGHLNQSLSVVEEIKKYRKDDGYQERDLEIDTLDVKFRSRLRKGLFKLLTPFITANCQGRLLLLKFALDKETFKNAGNKYADVIVSCASALVGVNKALKYENFARNITILDPGLLNRKNFDVIIIPRHDMEKIPSQRLVRLFSPRLISLWLRRKNLKWKIQKCKEKYDNVVVTELAPNLIDVSDMQISSEKNCIGILFGGENRDFTFGEELVRSLSKALKETCNKEGVCFRITTSRRTSKMSEDILSEELKNEPACKGFVIGKEDRNPDTVQEILQESGIIVVSGESISMVSEAVSSGKPVLVFMPDKKSGRKTKYERFVERLGYSGVLKAVKIEDIPKTVSDISKGGTLFSFPDDGNKIYEKLYRLF